MEPSYFEGRVKIGGRDIEWTSAFPKSLGFECAKCGLCCMGKIGLTRLDLADFTKGGIADLVDPVNMPSFGTPFDRLIRRKPDGSCLNLGEKSLCAIYPKRPMVCRCYPFLLSPGYEGNAIMDVMLHCPYVDIRGSEKNIPRKELDQVALEYAKTTPGTMLNTIDYLLALTEHARAVVPAAFFPSERKFRFMSKAIDLMRFDNPQDIAETSKNWAGALSGSLHDAIIQRDICDYQNMPSDAELLAPVSYTAAKAGFDKGRFKRVFSDMTPPFIFPEGGKPQAARTRLHFSGLTLSTQSGEKKASFGSMSRLEYTNESISMLKDYLNILVRRSSFQYCVARSVCFLTDYMRIGVVDFQMEAAILANALMPGIDPLARAMASVRGSDSINAEDMRYAIANTDSSFISGLVNDTVANEIVRAVSSGISAKSKKRGKIGF